MNVFGFQIFCQFSAFPFDIGIVYNIDRDITCIILSNTRILFRIFWVVDKTKLVIEDISVMELNKVLFGAFK